MTGSTDKADKLANIRFAVNEYADATLSCPVRTGASKGLFCSRCGAGSGQTCGLEIDAGRTLVKAAQYYTDPTLDGGAAIPASDPLAAMADRMGSSAMSLAAERMHLDSMDGQQYDTIRNMVERHCYEALKAEATAIVDRLLQEAHEWTVDRMPAAAKDASAKAAGADIVRRRIEHLLRS